MSYAADITVPGDILMCLADQGMQTGRSAVVPRGSGIRVEAKDAVAFRAALNSVCKLLIVHEKMRAIAK